jgi:hypothetical protein
MMNDTDNIVYNTAIAFGIPAAVAQMVVDQARNESGQYTSNLAVNYNNLFGMTYAGQSLASQGPLQPESNGQTYYAAYNSIQDSVNDLCQWLVNRQNNGTLTIANLTTPILYATALHDNDYFEGETPEVYAADMASIDVTVFGGQPLTGSGGTGDVSTQGNQGGGTVIDNTGGGVPAPSGNNGLLWAVGIGLGILILSRK